MADSLLTLVNDALGERGFAQLSTIVGNTDTDAVQILRLAQREGDSLAQNIPVWNFLKTEYTVALTPGVQTYAMPGGFRWMLPDTNWDRSLRRPMQGPLTSAEWQYFKGWASNFGLNYRFRIRNNLLEIDQTVTAADTIAFEYASKYWVTTVASPTTPVAAAFTADTDTQVFDEPLFKLGIQWRFASVKGFDFSQAFSEYTAMRNVLAARSNGMRTIQMGGQRDRRLGVNVPDQGLG